MPHCPEQNIAPNRKERCNGACALDENLQIIAWKLEETGPRSFSQAVAIHFGTESVLPGIGDAQSGEGQRLHVGIRLRRVDSRVTYSK